MALVGGWHGKVVLRTGYVHEISGFEAEAGRIGFRPRGWTLRVVKFS